MSNNNFKSKQKVRPNCSPGFQYLKPRNIENKYAPENAKCLMSNYTPIPGSLIIRDLSYDSDYGLFHYFPQLELLEPAVPSNSDHRIEEYIGADCLQRPKYDIDGYADTWLLDTAISCIQVQFIHLGIMEPEIVICDSSGIDNTTGIHKNSCHLIITNCLFKNAADACEVSELIQSTFTNMLVDAFGQELGEKYAKCYDHGVNNGSAHNLRTPLSAKNGRIKQVPNGYRREDLLITCGFQPNLPILDVRHRPKESEIQHEFILADTARILELAAECTTGWSFTGRHGNIINFSRTYQAEHYCDICARDHEKDNSLYLLIMPTGIWRGCGRMTDKKLPFTARFRLIAGNTTAGITTNIVHMIEDAPKIHIDSAQIITADIDNVINTAGLHLHGYTYTGRAGNYLNFTALINVWCMVCQARHESTDSARILLTKRAAYYQCNHSSKELMIAALNTVNDIVNTEPTMPIIGNIPALSEIYDERFIRPFPKETRTLYVRANTGTGKTKAAMDYVGNGTLIISFRKSYTADKLRAYNVGRDNTNKFVSYLDIVGRISLKKYPNLIIQAESLGRLKLKYPPKILILDESESIFDEFKSDTMRDQFNCINALGWLMSAAERCLAIDANLGPRTFEHIRRERGTDGELFIQNTYKSRADTKILLTTDRPTIAKKILLAAERGQNIVIPTNCKEFADDICAQIAEKMPVIKILKITKDMPDKEKAEMFANVAAIWPQYQVVIYTPTCTAGISFELPHFAAAYCYFTNNSCTVQACCQMMARVRDISSREYYVCIDAKYSNARECSLLEVRRSVQAMANLAPNDAKELRALQHTRPRWVGDKYIPSEFDTNLMFDIITHAMYIQNQTRANMLRLFIDMWKITGATVIAIDEIDRDEAKYIRADTKENKKKTVEISAEQILLATDVSPEEATYLSEKPMKTVADNAIISRFWLREHYGYAGNITKKFIIDYNNDKTIKIFKNLRDILRHKTAADALAELKERHNYVMASKIIDTRYPRHYVAHELLRLIGYDDILDRRKLTNAEISGNIAANYNGILALNKLIPATFGAGKKLFPQILGSSIKPILESINGIFTTTYGFSVMSTRTLSIKGKNFREDYKIKHKYYGILFDTTKSDNMPYIIIHRDDGDT